MDFTRYQHIERLGSPTTELDGLLSGTVYIFPKIDGSNHCVYYDKDLDRVAYASRNQLLSEGYDSTGFWHFADAHPGLAEFVERNPNIRIFGEFLTPHTLRNYEDYAWNKYYIFDMWDDDEERWLDADELFKAVSTIHGFGKPISDDICWIPTLAKFIDPSVQDILTAMDRDTFLLKEGTKGEGVVVKNYDYTNPYGRRTWGKIVREEFTRNSKTKDKGRKEPLPEEMAVSDSMTREFVEKEFHKFTDDRGVRWEDRVIPDFLKYIWEEWWRDLSFETLSKMGTVDMKAVRKMVSKEVMAIVNRMHMPKEGDQ